MKVFLRNILIAVMLSITVAACASLEGQMALRQEIAALSESNKQDQATLVALVSSNTIAKEFDRLLDDLIATDLNQDQWFGIEQFITEGQIALNILSDEKSTEEAIAKANTDLGNAMIGMRRWHNKIFPDRIVPVIPTFEPPVTE